MNSGPVKICAGCIGTCRGCVGCADSHADCLTAIGRLLRAYGKGCPPPCGLQHLHPLPCCPHGLASAPHAQHASLHAYALYMLHGFRLAPTCSSSCSSPATTGTSWTSARTATTMLLRQHKAPPSPRRCAACSRSWPAGHSGRTVSGCVCV